MRLECDADGRARKVTEEASQNLRQPMSKTRVDIEKIRTGHVAECRRNEKKRKSDPKTLSEDRDEKLWKKPGGFRIELPSEHMLKSMDQVIREHEKNHKPVSPEMNMAYQRIVRCVSEMPSDDSDFDDPSPGEPLAPMTKKRKE